jgi:exonuclease III
MRFTDAHCHLEHQWPSGALRLSASLVAPQPDIVGLQGLKLTDESFTYAELAAGYRSVAGPA